MYTNILIPTDGSALAGKAVQHGIALAKPIGAKITAVTVLPPFHTFATDRQMIEDTPAQYKIRMHEHAERTLVAVVRAESSRCRSSMSTLSSDHRYRGVKRMRSRGISAIVLGSETIKVHTHCYPGADPSLCFMELGRDSTAERSNGRRCGFLEAADAIEPSPPDNSFRGLDGVNLFLAGALSGFGPTSPYF